MFKEKATQKLIEYIQTFPKHERQVIAEQILNPKPKKNADKKEDIEDAGLAKAMKKGRTGEFVNTSTYLKKLKDK